MTRAPLPRLGAGRWRLAALLGVPSALALWMALAAPVGTLGAVPAALRAVLAAVLLFGVCGVGVTRIVLPERLRACEPLWVLPIGACVVAMGMTVLGYLAVPFPVALGALIVASLIFDVGVLRRRGFGWGDGPALGVPFYVGALVVAIALLPMFGAGFATVTGNGSDAHLAAGTAQFLQHSYPTSVNISGPVDQLPLTWRSKAPIYYALGSVATVAGMQTWQVLAAVAGVMLALAALGWFLVARELLGAGYVAALCAMGVTALDRMALHTGLNPYFNQTWGYFTLPFALVLAWRAVRAPRAGTIGLLALFLAVGAFAYPLALPIPLGALVVFALVERRARRRRGEPVARLWPPRFYRGARSLVWVLPLAALLAVPLYGVGEKVFTGAVVVLDPNRSLGAWGGDLQTFEPSWSFFSLGSATGSAVAIAAMLVLAVLLLRQRPRPLAWGLGVVMLVGLLFAVYFRQRAFGWYFEFKILAFVGPLVVVCAAVGAARLRRLSPVLLVAFLLAAQAGARQEVNTAGRQLSKDTVALSGWARALPRGASIRLDIWAPRQLWAAYFLASRPLCSEAPLLRTEYPRVPISIKADYVLAQPLNPPPSDHVGPPLRINAEYVLYKLRSDLPGPENCSRRRVQEVTAVHAF